MINSTILELFSYQWIVVLSFNKALSSISSLKRSRMLSIPGTLDWKKAAPSSTSLFFLYSCLKSSKFTGLFNPCKSRKENTTFCFGNQKCYRIGDWMTPFQAMDFKWSVFRLYCPRYSKITKLLCISTFPS